MSSSHFVEKKNDNGIQMDVYLCGTSCCFSYCQHIEATITDLKTGRKFDINYPNADSTIFSADTKSKLQKEHESYCDKRVSTIFSPLEFDSFIKDWENSQFGSKNNYDFCDKNCGDAILWAVGKLCPEHKDIAAYCCFYKSICCLPFFFTFGLKCFPSICCTTPSDVFDFVLALSLGKYGALSSALVQEELKHAISDKDKASISAMIEIKKAESTSSSTKTTTQNTISELDEIQVSASFSNQVIFHY